MRSRTSISVVVVLVALPVLVGATGPPAGHVIAVCGDAPCYLDGWTGPEQ